MDVASGVQKQSTPNPAWIYLERHESDFSIDASITERIGD